METEAKRKTIARTVRVVPAVRYVRPEVFEEITGYTVTAQKRKRQDGVWTLGNEFIKAPDGLILMDIEGYNRWVESASKLGADR